MPFEKTKCGECGESHKCCPECGSIDVKGLIKGGTYGIPAEIITYGEDGTYTYFNYCRECDWKETVTVEINRA